MPSFFSTATDVLVRGALDGLAERHRAYVNNLANVDTPGFKPGEVHFEDALREVAEELSLHPDRVQFASVSPVKVEEDDQFADRMDGNGVSADRQAMKLADNSLTYETLVQAARMRSDIMKAVVSDGRR